MPQHDQQIELVFIINGANVSVRTSVDAPLREAVTRALADSGNTGRPASDWQVRNAAGILLEVDRKIRDFGFVNGTRLFLSLAVGAGGNAYEAL